MVAINLGGGKPVVGCRQFLCVKNTKVDLFSSTINDSSPSSASRMAYPLIFWNSPRSPPLYLDHLGLPTVAWWGLDRCFHDNVRNTDEDCQSRRHVAPKSDLIFLIKTPTILTKFPFSKFPSLSHNNQQKWVRIIWSRRRGCFWQPSSSWVWPLHGLLPPSKRRWSL